MKTWVISKKDNQIICCYLDNEHEIVSFTSDSHTNPHISLHFQTNTEFSNFTELLPDEIKQTLLYYSNAENPLNYDFQNANEAELMLLFTIIHTIYPLNNEMKQTISSFFNIDLSQFDFDAASKSIVQERLIQIMGQLEQIGEDNKKIIQELKINPGYLVDLTFHTDLSNNDNLKSDNKKLKENNLELQAENEKLRAENEKLRAENEKLRTENNNYKRLLNSQGLLKSFNKENQSNSSSYCSKKETRILKK